MALHRYSVRLAMLSDRLFLRSMLYEAAFPVGRDRPPADEFYRSDAAKAFLDGWGRPGDHGVIAEADFEPVGAAWFRVFDEGDTEAGFVAGETPELVIAVEPAHRGRGVGGLLLDGLLQAARQERYSAIGLNVPVRDAPAVSLFRRMGFETTRDRDGILTMLARLV
ncbi:MAG TPA: GNAT family N-acetyltransferase [Acidimicrobiales bacterium]|nr:GNAT family N-acetyltransferase [Acidimicrobiales bacterium]